MKYYQQYKEYAKSEIQKELELELEEKVSKEVVDEEYQKQENQKSMKKQQEEQFKSIANQIFKTSKQFDVDASAHNSLYDNLIEENVLQKSLENDNLLYIEGMRLEYQVDFQTKQ